MRTDRGSRYDSRMARGLDKEQAAVDTGILDITVTLSREFFAEVGRVLVLNVLHDGVPTKRIISSTVWKWTGRLIDCSVPSVVVDLITIARSVDNVQPETDPIFLNDL